MDVEEELETVWGIVLEGYALKRCSGFIKLKSAPQPSADACNDKGFLKILGSGFVVAQLSFSGELWFVNIPFEQSQEPSKWKHWETKLIRQEKSRWPGLSAGPCSGKKMIYLFHVMRAVRWNRKVVFYVLFAKQYQSIMSWNDTIKIFIQFYWRAVIPFTQKILLIDQVSLIGLYGMELKLLIMILYVIVKMIRNTAIKLGGAKWCKQSLNLKPKCFIFLMCVIT